jgi:hypothetical protein
VILEEPGLSPDYMSLRRLLQHLFPSGDTTPLRDRIDGLEVAMRRLEEEWTEVYGKFRTMQLRIAKQVQRLDADSSHEEPQGAGGGESAVQASLSNLSPRAREVQRQILARRARGQNGGE